jgi:hypothetical protein
MTPESQLSKEDKLAFLYANNAPRQFKPSKARLALALLAPCTIFFCDYSLTVFKYGSVRCPEEKSHLALKCVVCLMFPLLLNVFPLAFLIAL